MCTLYTYILTVSEINSDAISQIKYQQPAFLEFHKRPFSWLPHYQKSQLTYGKKLYGGYDISDIT